jgi:hypothetical protein
MAFDSVPTCTSTLAVQPKVIDRSAAVAAQHARGVRVVDHHDGAVFFGQRGQLVHRADVAIHREDAVGDHQLVARLVGELLQQLFAVGGILVAEDLDLGRDSRAPSMMLAWFSSSERMKSSLPRMALTVPALAAKPLWKTTQASTFLKRAIFSSSSMWMRMVPAMVRTAPEPTPNARGGDGRFNQLGMVGQAEIVVAGQVDDLLPS